jgi:hypothetical protein
LSSKSDRQLERVATPRAARLEQSRTRLIHAARSYSSVAFFWKNCCGFDEVKSADFFCSSRTETWRSVRTMLRRSRPSR